MRNRPPTIRDVAQLAGVSPATVSNVLTTRRPVTAALSERVRAAVAELGYVADFAASRLRTREAGVVAALVPDLRNPFFAALVGALEEFAHADGFALIVASSDGIAAREHARLQALIAWRPAGVLAVPADDAFAAREVVQRARLPVVLLDRVPEPCPFDSVAIDNSAAAATAIRHLALRGHRHVLIVASSRALSNVRERIAGAERAALPAGVRVEVVEAGHAPEGTRAAVASRLARTPLPTALFALTVDGTLGALQGLHDRGLEVGRDAALLGFDDYGWMGAVNPPISAVRQPVDAIAASAWERLVARIAGDDDPPVHLRLACALEVRASCAVPQPDAPATVRDDPVIRDDQGGSVRMMSFAQGGPR